MPIVAGLIVRKMKDKIIADARHLDLIVGERVVVETDHGLEMATVYEKERIEDKPKEPVHQVIRKFNSDDIKCQAENENKGVQAHKTVLQKIQDHELDMKLTSVQYTHDRSKLFIYYTAENRIDFRELIKDLGHILKTRIQMVQIGVRDEAKLIGGLGHCGRKLCCKEFLKGFSSVTIDMAKEQDLSLNTAKLSGLCGRLMCCLAYENECYKNARKKLPALGAKVHTPAGHGTVVGIERLKEEVTIELDDKSIKKFKAEDITHTLRDKIGI